jgi:hypothetical protein
MKEQAQVTKMYAQSAGLLRMLATLRTASPDAYRHLIVGAVGMVNATVVEWMERAKDDDAVSDSDYTAMVTTWVMLRELLAHEFDYEAAAKCCEQSGESAGTTEGRMKH